MVSCASPGVVGVDFVDIEEVYRQVHGYFGEVFRQVHGYFGEVFRQVMDFPVKYLGTVHGYFDEVFNRYIGTWVGLVMYRIVGNRKPFQPVKMGRGEVGNIHSTVQW